MQFVENLRFLFQNREDVKIHIKTLDTLVNEKESERFYNIFSPISDTINIEKTVPYFRNIEYTDKVAERQNLNVVGMIMQKCKICPSQFYTMFIYATGDVIPCCEYFGPTIGNIFKQDMHEIWNNKKHKKLMWLSLIGNENKKCIGCITKNAQIMPSDNIDNYANKILEKLDWKTRPIL
jgi:radical SAM protein with 4Fe4S-binding SPASM domain